MVDDQNDDEDNDYSLQVGSLKTLNMTFEH